MFQTTASSPAVRRPTLYAGSGAASLDTEISTLLQLGQKTLPDWSIGADVPGQSWA